MMGTPRTRSGTGINLRLIGPATTIIILAASSCGGTSNSTAAPPPTTSVGSYNPSNIAAGGGPAPAPEPAGSYNPSNNAAGGKAPPPTGSYNTNNNESGGSYNTSDYSGGSYNPNNNYGAGTPVPVPNGGGNTTSAASGGGLGGGSSSPLQFSGTGSGRSAQFLVNVNTVTAHYTYDCSAVGDSGDFSADMVSGDPSSPNYDDQSIADTSGSSSSATVTISPQDVGSYYNLQITTPCSWSITLQAG